MLREILPNILSPVIVVSTIRMAHVIILEASLSFLGIGVQPPTASWGSLVADGRSFIMGRLVDLHAFPGFAILHAGAGHQCRQPGAARRLRSAFAVGPPCMKQ
jgi:ABC-type dipeptide/oligopeptide/nickel transport system permease subunit